MCPSVDPNQQQQQQPYDKHQLVCRTVTLPLQCKLHNCQQLLLLLLLLWSLTSFLVQSTRQACMPPGFEHLVLFAATMTDPQRAMN